MGMEGAHEFFFISVNKDMVCDELVRKINLELPEGLVINECETAGPGKANQKDRVDHYTVTLKEGVFDRHQLAWFVESNSIEYTFTNKKGIPGTIDLKESILNIALIMPNSIELTIQNQGGKRVRPAMVLERVFALPEEDIKKALIIKGGTHV